MTPHGPWNITSSKEVYRDPWLDLRLDQVIRPDGLPGTYSTVRLKPGVCVVAIDDDESLFLTKEFHYAVGRYTVEGVSGGVEADEEPLRAAQRELAEELGIRAKHWRELATIDPFTASVNSPTRLFAAAGLSFQAAENEGTEQIERIHVPFEQAMTWFEDGTITHAPTCITLLKLALLRRSQTGLHASLGIA